MPLPTVTYTSAEGLRCDGEPVDAAELRAWIEPARELLRQCEAADEDRRWAERLAQALRNLVVRLHLTDVQEPNRYGYRQARQDGLPVVVGRHDARPAYDWREVGPGPALEYRVAGGRKWWPQSREHIGSVAEWRVAP